MTRPRGVWAIALFLGACSARPIALEGFEAMDFAAALVRDDAGRYVRGSEVRALDGPLDVVSADGDDVVVVGWSAAALAGLRPDPAQAVAPRTGCAPRLPSPGAAVALADGATIDVSTIPALTVPWADALCAPRAPSDYAFRTSCREARPTWTTDRTGACTYLLELEGRSLSARIEPDDGLCVAPVAAGDASCAPVAPRALADATLRCDLPARCDIDVYAAPRTPALVKQARALLEVPPFVPDVSLTGAQPQLPPFGRYVGYAYDAAVVGDRVLVSTSTGVARQACGSGAARGLLHALRADDLTPLARADGPACLTLLSSTGTRAVGLAVRGEGFSVVEVSPTLAVREVGPLDDRAEPIAPGAPPIARAGCERPIDLLVGDTRVWVVMERLAACTTTPGATVHVLDRRTLRPIARRAVDAQAPWAAQLAGDRLLLALATERAVLVLDTGTLEVMGRRTIPPDLTRNDTVIADVAVDGEDLLATTTRNQPAIRRSARDEDFGDRGFFVEHDADPTALWPAFDGPRGLVIGVRDGDRRAWPAEAALYDRETLTVLPGAIPIGEGPPRRLRSDGRGGVIALLPWDATVVRVSLAPR